MLKRIAYTDANKATIISQQLALGFREIEDQRYIDGNWLIFTDEPLIDWKAEWALADTVAKKFAVLAKLLKLE